MSKWERGRTRGRKEGGGGRKEEREEEGRKEGGGEGRREERVGGGRRRGWKKKARKGWLTFTQGYHPATILTCFVVEVPNLQGPIMATCHLEREKSKS